MENIPVCNLNFALPVCRMKVKMQQQLLQLQSPRLWPGILKQAACKINSTRQKAAQCRLQEELLHTLA